MLQTTLDAFPDINAEHGASDEMFLVFSIADQGYALDISYVTEIIEMLPIFPIPNMPACLKGVINLRGVVVPVMDIRLRFGLEQKEYNERTCIVVVEMEGISLGMIVDSVQEVMTIRPEDRLLPPSGNTDPAARYIQHISPQGEQVLLLLCCEKLMDIAP
ncbi:chemotaxis protein CheW [Christensenellaceae bacterium OttesenSCG-928-L17]|nr:chemotaxis protein CheW [Christensenellaceae bacterium OttesenSCG-928-L17]